MTSDVATKLRVFNANTGSTTGSGGFVNYNGASVADIDRTLDKVFAEWPDAVVIDGDDNWSGHEKNRPEVFARKAGVTPLALFHTRISGATHSGIVVSSADFDRLAAFYTARYGEPLIPTRERDRKAWHVRPLVYTQDNYDGYDPEGLL